MAYQERDSTVSEIQHPFWRRQSIDEKNEFELEISYEEEEEAEDDIDENLCGDDELKQPSTAQLRGDNEINLDDMEEVKLEDVHTLLQHIAKNIYRTKNESKEDEAIMKKCHLLFSRDYHCFVINNAGGELSSHYPSKIVILEYEIKSLKPQMSLNKQLGEESDSAYQSLYDPGKLQDLCQKARLARCRARFPVPVILLDGKHICRSATLSGGPEIYGRSSYDFFFSGKSGASLGDDDLDDDEDDAPFPPTSSDWQLFDRVRALDIKLLKLFSVTHICDLMVEKKKVKFGMNITSSEKVDKEKRYSEFTILSLPYPGCEFFKEFSSNGYNANGLVYAWNQAFIDARLVIPNDRLTSKLDIDWNSYKNWDVIKLTQNYFKLLLKYIKSGNGGLLIHCISGWDRTPLFVSLLRISLWADGEIHKSLGPLEILYLTLAYDWYLFGHNLADRFGKREEILFFCFEFLKFIVSEDYAVHKSRRRTRKLSDFDPLFSENQLLESCTTLGSNTSLNSSSSSISSRSQDCPPSYFTTTAYDSFDDSGGTVASMNHLSSAQQSKQPSCEPAKRMSTSPVAVPAHSAKSFDTASTVGFGSWQLISSTGSVRSSTPTKNSLSSQTPSSEHSAHSHQGRSGFTWSEVTGDGELQLRHHHPRLCRVRRLRDVREAFYNLYVGRLGDSNTPEQSAGGGLSGLLDQFAEKVGIKTGRSAH